MIHLKAVYTGLSRGSRKGKLCRRVKNDVTYVTPAEPQRNGLARDATRAPRLGCCPGTDRVVHTGTVAQLSLRMHPVGIEDVAQCG